MGPKFSPESITNSILCTPRELSSTGTSEKVWKRENSPRPVRISPPSRRITKKSVSRPPRLRPKRRAWKNEQSAYHPTPEIWLFITCLNCLLRASLYEEKKPIATLDESTAEDQT